MRNGTGLACIGQAWERVWRYGVCGTELAYGATRHTKAMETLLAAKADINAVGDNGETSLIIACASSQKEAAQVVKRQNVPALSNATGQTRPSWSNVKGSNVTYRRCCCLSVTVSVT
eukprot:3644184-Rhodomonas_salina.2